MENNNFKVKDINKIKLNEVIEVYSKMNIRFIIKDGKIKWIGGGK